MENTKSKILLVDDETDIIILYKMKLEKAGFRVSTALNGEESLVIAAKEQPDLILMDMKMPIMDGITAQKRLRADKETAGLRVVFLTAFSDPMNLEVDKDMLIGDGVLGFIKKGVSLEEFVDEVKKYLSI